MRIGVLTGGGDVPGLNSVIKSVVYRATETGNEVLGIRRGWEGLTHVRPDRGSDLEYVVPLDRLNTRTIDRVGGTILHTSRTNPRRMPADRLPEHLRSEASPYVSPEGTYDLTPLVLANIEALALDRLVVIGGDDTLSFAQVLTAKGFPLVAIPKTMDNDVQGTEYCVGFSTAITRAKELVNRQRTTLGSHERIGVFRIFGRDAGFSALHAAYVTSARCVIPEAPFEIQRLVDILVADKRANPSRYAFVIAAEGATWSGMTHVGEVGEADEYGHRHKADVGEVLASEIHRRSGEDVLVSHLTYDLRSGDPDAFDQMVATTFANIAVDLLASGVSGRMVAIRDGKYAHTTLPDPALGSRRVDVDRQYDRERFRPRYSGRLGYSFFLEGPV